MINGDTLNPQVKDIVTEWTVMKGTKIGRSYYHCSTGHLTLSLRNSFVFLTVPINRQVLFYINIFLTSLKLISTMRSNCYFEFPTYFITRLHFVEYLFSSEGEFFFESFYWSFSIDKSQKIWFCIQAKVRDSFTCNKIRHWVFNDFHRLIMAYCSAKKSTTTLSSTFQCRRENSAASFAKLLIHNSVKSMSTNDVSVCCKICFSMLQKRRFFSFSISKNNGVL